MGSAAASCQRAVQRLVEETTDPHRRDRELEQAPVELEDRDRRPESRLQIGVRGDVALAEGRGAPAVRRALLEQGLDDRAGLFAELAAVTAVEDQVGDV